VPGIPGGACSAAAAALTPAGLGGVCQAASAATSAASSGASQVAGAGVSSVLGDLGSWVAEGASWLLGQIGAVLGDSTSIDLGASWFGAHYATMAELAGVVIVPLLLLGIIQSVYRQNLSALLRSVLVNVPLAILLTAVAVKLVQLGLSLTDALSTAVAHGAGLDAANFMSTVVTGLSDGSIASPAVPTFVLFLGALAVVVGAVLVWVELLIRTAAVYVAVLFLPLALASLAWPSIAHWCRRLVDTLVALILGKFVIVSVLSLAAGALAGGTGSTPSGVSAGPAAPAASAASVASAGSGGGGFTAVLGGAALLLLSAFAPWALFRLLPFVEAGAVAHLEGLSHRARQAGTVPIRGLAQTAMRVAGSGALASAGPAMAGAALGGTMAGDRAGGRAGGAAGGRAGAAAGRAASGGRGRGGGVGIPGGDGSPDGAPDLGPSSVETTGVGTMEPPGYGIPMYEVHPGVTAAFNRLDLEQPDGPGPGSGPSPSPSPSPLSALSTPSGSGGAEVVRSPPAESGLVPLPRQSGALHDDYLGRDHMGPKLVTRPRTNLDRPNGPGPAGG